MTTKKNNPPDGNDDAVQIAGSIVAAYVGKNNVKADDLPALLTDVYAAVTGLSEQTSKFRATSAPAVPIEKSVTANYIICLEDGKKLKMLKRYLRTHFDMSPDDYRRKWGLPVDYPMTAPNYAKTRSKLAKSFGLGTARGSRTKKSTKKTRR
ncbi:MAG: MucR family transcriptional regulator [Pseudomonadota bacterium]